MPASIIELNQNYKSFRRKYKHLLLAAKREMDTPLQKGLVDSIAATAFSAGYNDPHRPAKPLDLKTRVWAKGVR